MNYLSGAKRRIGNAEKLKEKQHEQYMGSYDVFFTDHVSIDAHHEAEGALNLLRFLHQPIRDLKAEVWLEENDKVSAKRLLTEAGVGMGRKKIIVCLTTSDPSRDWPVEKYVAVCQQIKKSHDAEFLLVGAGKTAIMAAKRFCAAFPEAHDFTGQMTLRETAALMKLANFHLGGDTGTAHIAAACGLRGVVLYKSVRWDGHPWEDLSQWFAPWQSQLQIIQPKHALPGCEKMCVSKEAHCIKLITVEEVVQAMECVMQSV